MPDPACERAQLTRNRRRRTFAQVIAPGRAAVAVGRPAQAAQSGVSRGPPVLDSGLRQVSHPSTEGGVAPLPVLLLAASEDRLVKAADLLQRSASQRHVRAPDELDVLIMGAQIERRERG